MNYKEIMYTVGQLVRCVYGVDVPVNVQNTITRFPAKGIGLMNQRGDIINTPDQDEVMRLMDKIPGDLVGGTRCLLVRLLSLRKNNR